MERDRIRTIVEELKADPAQIGSLAEALSDKRAAGDQPVEVKGESILDRWDITAEEFTSLVDSSPSLRGMLFGYVAEFKFSKIWLVHRDVGYAVKPDDHDRRKKGDRIILYKGHEFSIEVKSLQTNSIRRLPDGTWYGKAQCDGSDRRIVTFPDGTQLATTCLIVGQFNLLAVNCFGFERSWAFAFARNIELPRSTFTKYPPEHRQQLLASLVPVTWPPKPPFYEEPFGLLDAMARDRTA